MTTDPLELTRHLVDFGMLVVLWLVQLVIYPSFFKIRGEALVEWHRRYTFRVSFIIMPLMLAQLGLHGWFAVTGVSWVDRTTLGLVVVCWILTFFVSVPLHRRIDAGETDSATLRRLVATNWPRTALWSAIFVVGLVGDG